MKAIHNIEPIYNELSQIIILGSMPSPVSRKKVFFYAHPQNRFWKVLALVYHEPCPATCDDKKKFLEQHKIALYDVLLECNIQGSLDESIKNPVPTKLLPLLKNSNITRIYTTGKKAYALYQKYQEKELDLKAILLPSTSSLNRMTEEELVKSYQVIQNKELSPIVDILLLWYNKEKRDLPWRKTNDAYAIWISEIMLQQTRVEAVLSYYERFLKAFPDIFSLANAKDDELLKLWEGLGYYSRARNLKKAAMIIVNDYGGVFPKDYDAIRKLPGIGSYTAGAISSIAYHLPYPAVDGNVFRVLSRVFALSEDITLPLTRLKMEHRVKEILTEENASLVNQALMELGATICLFKGAKCEKCPLAFLCRAYQNNEVEHFPVKGKKLIKQEVFKTILILNCNGRYAILKREDKGLLAGLYQFPEMENHASQKEVIAWCRKQKLMQIRINIR